MCLVGLRYNYLTAFRNRDFTHIQEQKDIESLSENKNSVYFYHTGLHLMNSYKSFDSMPIGLVDNIFPLGDWETNTPIQLDLFKSKNITNPYRDMVEKNNCYLIADTNSVKLIMKYINTWYAPNAKAELVKEYQNWSVYSIIN